MPRSPILTVGIALCSFSINPLLIILLQTAGHSTVSPQSSIPRIYPTAYLNSSTFLPLRPFDKLIKGASYVASDCHHRDSANSHRDEHVSTLKRGKSNAILNEKYPMTLYESTFINFLLN